ncbi:hypothetical protein EDC40_101193 [Aminobacter aminovorans]|uniref:Uncharacterized protein n=2 Tax=Aminobacter aminovorans TaxID=83263 RepID=A0A380WP60_AMIAI|nr:hypothetical protein EDC40_101193 [Aminobacter aminovorans]SUU90727.1 Uncharacterised protein [Aminobacter aminovorans]
MHASMSEKLASYGQWTYRGAWALEIAAATIGLATGLALGLQAFSASQTATAMDLTLASAPFFMVAIAELTKIPIATLLFSASWLWKPVILAFLLVLAAITFETVFMGLERAATLRQLQYEELANRIDQLRAEASELAAADELARKTDRVADAKSVMDETVAQADRELAAIQAEIEDVKTELLATTALTPAAAAVRDQINEKEQARAALLAQRDREAKEAGDGFERQRDSFDKRIAMARSAGDTDSARRLEAEVAKLANPRPRIIAKFDQTIEPLDGDLNRLRAEFDRLRASGPAMTAAQRNKLTDQKDGLERLYASTASDWQARKDDARERWAHAQEAEANEARTAAANQLRQDAIATQIVADEKQRIPIARTDQVRRIAGRWYGVKPEEVSESQAGSVSVIWFGSLALIAALAGPITAMVALGLQRIAARAEHRVEGRLSRLIRTLLLKWRWRRTRTITVPVEVPVDREVEKRVEVPVERVVKEILYVPLLTDDPDALRKALDADLPSDVAELVKISARNRVAARNGVADTVSAENGASATDGVTATDGVSATDGVWAKNGRRRRASST